MVNLLVGMAMGLSLLSAAVFWVHFQWTHDRKILERSHAQQETRALMDTLVHDIRRANFHSASITNNKGTRKRITSTPLRTKMKCQKSFS